MSSVVSFPLRFITHSTFTHHKLRHSFLIPFASLKSPLGHPFYVPTSHSDP